MDRLPKISVITPSFNQVDFIERTVRSVIGQGYPNLEYIVVDNQSKDGTLEILRDYRKQIILISETDKGQAEAINKGLKKSTGEIVTYLNSDDILLKDALFKVAKVFQENPEVNWVTGYCQIIDENDQEIRKKITAYKKFWLNHYHYLTLLVLNYISQPATFWRRKLVEEIGFFDESLFYTMDYDYWLRLGKRYKPYIVKDYLAKFRVHRKSKSVLGFQKQFFEEFQVAKRYTNSKFLLTLHRLHYYFFILGPYSLLPLLQR